MPSFSLKVLLPGLDWNGLDKLNNAKENQVWEMEKRQKQICAAQLWLLFPWKDSQVISVRELHGFSRHQSPGVLVTHRM